ncbi:MAG: GNAT family N-acetyltransferase [Bacteroidetes bacterium]|nr:GNAT family N-acetyltransferase [Bacteroidota bacterium]
MNTLKFIKATEKDHRSLTALTLRSKAYWGYSLEQIESWRKILTITKDYIKKNSIFIGKADGKIAGYYSWIKTSNDAVELDNMFLDPEYIGKGNGSLLLEDFLSRMRSGGIHKILLYADPNAERFYKKFGFSKIGRSESSIKGRYLPIMQLEIKGENHLSG